VHFALASVDQELFSFLQVAGDAPNPVGPKVLDEQSGVVSGLQRASVIGFPESVFDFQTLEQLERVSRKRAMQQELSLSQRDASTNQAPRGSRCTFQIGYPRTASTLQFTEMCVMKIIQNPGEDVKCVFGANASMLQNCESGDGVLVSKEHSPPQVGEKLQMAFGKNKPTNFDIVMSLPEDPDSDFKNGKWYNASQNVSKEWKMEIKATHSITDLKKRGMFVVNDFQSIYNLTDDDMDQVRNILRYYTVLRQCCGQQMSHDWRSELQGSEFQGNKKNKQIHWNKQSTVYPACQMYDIDAVQTELFALPLWWDLVRAADMSMQRTAFFTKIDPKGARYLNCSRSNAYVAVHPELGQNKGTPMETYDEDDS